MKIRTIITGVLVLAAVGGAIFALTGDGDQAGETIAEAADNPGTTAEAAADPAAKDPQDAVDPAAAINPALQDELPVDGVVVYYFHGRQRCYTCNKMESLADAVVHEKFADYLDDGLVVFRSINVQTQETSHFAKDFELHSAGIVMVERLNGEQLRWRRLDEVWTKVRNDDAYKAYIAENLTGCLREVGLEKKS